MWAFGLMALLVADLGLGLVVGQAIAASIKQPLEATLNAVKRIADGDLETQVAIGKDKIFWIGHELKPDAQEAAQHHDRRA